MSSDLSARLTRLITHRPESLCCARQGCYRVKRIGGIGGNACTIRDGSRSYAGVFFKHSIGLEFHGALVCGASRAKCLASSSESSSLAKERRSNNNNNNNNNNVENTPTLTTKRERGKLRCDYGTQQQLNECTQLDFFFRTEPVIEVFLPNFFFFFLGGRVDALKAGQRYSKIHKCTSIASR